MRPERRMPPPASAGQSSLPLNGRERQRDHRAPARGAPPAARRARVSCEAVLGLLQLADELRVEIATAVDVGNERHARRHRRVQAARTLGPRHAQRGELGQPPLEVGGPAVSDETDGRRKSAMRSRSMRARADTRR